jgi:Mn2+/Fe2+ NRAMP family transporter
MKRIKQRFWILIGAVITICIFLNWLVFQKTAPDFPVIFRSNEFGINFLGHRNLLWIIPILGVVFIGLNFWLSQLFQENNRIQEKNLNWLLFFANIGIAILVLLLSVQIYFLNR